MSTTTTHTEKANEYRAEAAKADERNARRIEDQVDPGDSFLSSWADGLTSRLYRAKAEIEEAGGVSEFFGLFNLKGERVRAKLIEGRYGLCWALCDGNGRFTGKFVTFIGHAPTMPWVAKHGETEAERLHGKDIYRREIKSWARRVKNQAKKGFREGREMAPAEAYMDGEGFGLSGRAWVAVKRTDGGFPENAVSA
jgi:hypothetical protein